MGYSYLPNAEKNILDKIRSKSQYSSTDGLKGATDVGQQFQMIDALPEAVYVTDAEGHLTHFNPAAVEFSGRTPELGTDQWCVTWKLFYPDGTPMPHEDCPMAIAIKEGRSIKGAEAIAERPDGERIWFEAYPSPLRDDDGNITGAINMLIDITDRKQAEKKSNQNNKALQESEKRLSTIFKTTPECIKTVAADGTLLQMNPAGLNMVEADTASDVVGKRVYGLIAPEYHDEFKAFNEKICRGESGTLQFDVIGLNGTRRHLETHAVPISNPDGTVAQLALTRNITDQKQAHEKLRKNERKYRTLFESIDEGFCIIKIMFDKNGNPEDYLFEEVNPAFEEHTGLKDVKGKTMREIAPNHEDYWFEIYGEVVRTGDPIRFEQSARELDRILELFAFPIGEQGNDQVAVLFKDVTEQKQAQAEREQLLREVENERERLKEIFQRAPSFMCIVQGSDHVFERVNDLYCKLVGDRELLGKPVREALPEVEGQGFFELLDQVYETGEAYSATDNRILLEQEEGKEPEERFVDFVYQPLWDSDGEVTGIFVQGVDLTERRKAKEQLQEMNTTLEKRVEKRTESLLSYQEQLRSLASQLSKAEEQERHRLAAELHDNLGQMLAVNKMKIELLQQENISGKAVDKIKEIKKGLNEALVYTRKLMSDLKPPPSLDKEDITATLEWLTEKMKERGLELKLSDDGEVKQVDEEVRTTLLQSVRELLFNVLKHSKVNEAQVSMSVLGNQVKIVVEDEGQGFDPETNPSSSPEEGGFGLFNIRERIDLLGGNVDIRSKPGEGTKVTIFAPLKESELTKFPKEDKVESSVKKKKQKIEVMLVDDHQMMREGLKKIIDAEDDMVVIAEAANGEEAITLARESSPDVIMMDVNMPVMDGIDATQEITSFMPQVRVVGLSLHGHQQVRDSMRDAGATAYLSKEEAFESLCATVRSETRIAK